MTARNYIGTESTHHNYSLLLLKRKMRMDLFCDAGSTITGSVNLAGVPTAQCANLVGSEAALP